MPLTPAPSVCSRSHQRGVTLIALMLVLLVGSSALLLSRLNAQSGNELLRQQDSLELLRQARDALLGYAGSHPDYPGVLPWPDRGGDNNHDGNSDCSNASFSPNLMLGRLPVRGATAPCQNLTGLNLASTAEASGGIWYAVSRNLLRDYSSASYAQLNWDSIATPDYPWLTVRDASGAVISDEVAFVLMLGNAPLDYQDRDPASANVLDADNYLDSITVGATTWSNADADGCYDDNSGCGGSDGEDFIIANEEGVINDRILYVTASQIIEIIETRIAGDIRTMLEAYYSQFNRYPWLSPHLAAIRGQATAGSGGLSLTDSDRDYIDFGIRPGDTVVNESDGSSGRVATVAPNTLSVTSLTGGSASFSAGDQYRVQHYSKPLENALNFSHLGSPGQEVLTGSQEFFRSFSVSPGDWVHNLTDGSWGPLVDTFTASNFGTGRLTTDVLAHGTSNVFNLNDELRITRLNSLEGTRIGHLPVHEPGGAFPTGFIADWRLTATNGFVVTTDTTALPLTNPDAGYLATLQVLIQNSSATSGSITVDGASGSCIWTDLDTVRCAGSVADVGYLTGTADADSSGPTPVLLDNNRPASFLQLGVIAGDLLRNLTDGSSALITQVLSNSLALADLQGGTDNDIDTDDNYRVEPMSERVSGAIVAVLAASPPRYQIDVDLEASGVAAGDYMLNTTSGAYSRIAQVIAGAAPALPEVELDPAFSQPFSAGDGFSVRFHPVARRAYSFEFDFIGSGLPTSNGRFNGGKARQVILDAGVPGPLNVIRIEDFDAAGNLLASAEVRNPALPATASGDIVLEAIQYDCDLDQNDPWELPAWIRNNGWYRSVVVAIAEAHTPAGSGTCTAGSDCLEVLVGKKPPVPPPALPLEIIEADKRLVVIYHGRELPGQDQNQTRLTDFFEGENADDDDGDGFDADSDGSDGDLIHRFQQSPLAIPFNDRVVTTDGP